EIIKRMCMDEQLTMWGFREADRDAELKPVTPQAWQVLSINPLYDRATKGDDSPVIWTGLCFDRKQLVAAFVTGGGDGPPKARAAKPDANAEQEMTNYLEALVRSNPDIRPDDAWESCRLKFHHLGPRGSRQWRRIWPRARGQAGEKRKARPGRVGRAN